MGYRDAVPRPKRLWYVTYSYWAGAASVGHACLWVWAREGHEAISQAIDEKVKAEVVEKHSKVFAEHAICGEDFAEREAKGPDGSA
jgi:hypothetical protein